MQVITRCLLWCGLIAALTSCGTVTAPACGASCEGDLVVFGRVSVSWSDMAVPGATVTVELYGDTTRAFGHCAGTTPLAAVTQPLDAAGNYRVPVVVSDGATRWVCIEVTGDPHGWASDVGRSHASGGVIQLHAPPVGVQPDSVRVDFHYSGLA